MIGWLLDPVEFALAVAAVLVALAAVCLVEAPGFVDRARARRRPRRRGGPIL